VSYRNFLAIGVNDRYHCNHAVLLHNNFGPNRHCFARGSFPAIIAGKNLRVFKVKEAQAASSPLPLAPRETLLPQKPPISAEIKWESFPD
jgi:hypothetical protein